MAESSGVNDRLRQQFLSSLDMLEAVLSSDDAAASAAVHLRLLLFDGNPLAQRAAGSRRQKLLFAVSTVDSHTFPLAPRLAGSEAEDGVTTTLSREQFLSLHLATVRGVKVTVKTVIEYFTYVYGVAHAREPCTEAEKALDTLQTSSDSREVEWCANALFGIARAVLESLAELRSFMIDSSRFDKAPGLTVFLSIEMQPMGGDRDNLILDIGVERQRNRMMVLVDAEDRLVVRHFDKHGTRRQAQAPSRGLAFEYGRRMTLEVSTGALGAERLLRINTGRWCCERVVQWKPQDAPITAQAVVLGSDIDGSASSRFSVLEKAVFGRVVGGDALKELREYFDAQQPLSELVFSDRAFLHSHGHPLHTLAIHSQEVSPTGLVQREPTRQPLFRTRTASE